MLAIKTPIASCMRPLAPPGRKVLCQAQKDRPELNKQRAVNSAQLLAGALIAGALVPEHAMAAQTQGRIGGASGFKSRTSGVSRSSAGPPAPAAQSTSAVATTAAPAAPAAASPAAVHSAPQNTTIINNNTVVNSHPPPSPFGLSLGIGMPFGGFGMPFGGFGMPFGGVSVMPAVMMPGSAFGGLMAMFLLIPIMFIVVMLLRAILGAFSGSNNAPKKSGWGDL